MDNGNILEIKNLNVFLKDQNKEYQILHNINLSLKKGEIHSIVGESGCGKTMTAMSVMRLLPKKATITSGEIIFNGNNLLDYSNAEMRDIRGNKIALIPQDPMTSLNPLFTIENQLIETIKAHSDISNRQALRKIKEVMNLVQIPNAEEKLKCYPHEFSGGMKQRIIIAMALLCKPDIIIADEPTTALDVTIQKQIMDLLLDIKHEFNTTILFISHDLALISNYANFITVMYAGHIVEQAEKNTFFKNMKHPYSIALLNSLPNGNNLLRLKTIAGAPPSLQENICGCKFHPRCEMHEENLCNINFPDLKTISANHNCACFKVDSTLL